MTQRRIQIAVARADVAICAALRRLPLAAALAAILLLAVLAALRCGGDRVGADITSEGPEGDYTAQWHQWEEDEYDRDVG